MPSRFRFNLERKIIIISQKPQSTKERVRERKLNRQKIKGRLEVNESDQLKLHSLLSIKISKYSSCCCTHSNLIFLMPLLQIHQINCFYRHYAQCKSLLPPSSSSLRSPHRVYWEKEEEKKNMEKGAKNTALNALFTIIITF